MVAQEKNNRIEMQKSRDFDISLTRWGPDYADPTTYLNLLLEIHTTMEITQIKIMIVRWKKLLIQQMIRLDGNY